VNYDGAKERGIRRPSWDCRLEGFVIQFSSESEVAGGVFTGRVEHLSSGRRAHFHSPEELVATLRQLLAELGEVDR
jgi:hypothetical protein